MSKLKQDFGVRVLFGVLVVVPTVTTLIILSLKGSSEALIALVAMGSSVVAFYFGQRQAKP